MVGDALGECDAVAEGEGVGLCTLLERALLEVLSPGVVMPLGLMLAK